MSAVVISALVNLGVEGGKATDAFIKNFVNDTQAQLRFQLFQKFSLPYITDDDLVSFMKTGNMKLKDAKGLYFTIDSVELVGFLDKAGQTDRMKKLYDLYVNPQSTSNKIVDSISSQLQENTILQLSLKFWYIILIVILLLIMIIKGGDK